MKKLTASLIVITSSLAGCAVDDGYGYGSQGGTYIEQRSYGSAIGGTTWYREEVPYYPNHQHYDRNRNGIPDNREIDRNRNGIPDNREVDRNRNGVPDNREVDRNRNGIPDQREQDRNSVPDHREYDRNKNGKPDRPVSERKPDGASSRTSQLSDKFRDGRNDSR